MGLRAERALCPRPQTALPALHALQDLLEPLAFHAALAARCDRMHMHVRRQRRLRRGRWCGEGKGGRGSRTVLALPRLLPLRVLVLGLMRMLILQGWVKVSNDVARLSAVSGRSRDKRGPLRTVYVSLTFYKHAATDGRRMRKVASCVSYISHPGSINTLPQTRRTAQLCARTLPSALARASGTSSSRLE